MFINVNCENNNNKLKNTLLETECIYRGGSGSGNGSEVEVERTMGMYTERVICPSINSLTIVSSPVLKSLPVILSVEDMPSPSNLLWLQFLTKKEGGNFGYAWKTLDQAPGDCPLCPGNPTAINGGSGVLVEDFGSKCLWESPTFFHGRRNDLMLSCNTHSPTRVPTLQT